MKRYWFILCLLTLAACDNNYLESDNIEEMVVEGWIESGHAPVVMVTTTMPISSDPRPVSGIADHMLRYAEVYIEHNGEREYLTARLSDRFVTRNYFTSTTLHGVPGETYRLHVKWLDYEASAVCTIPQQVAIDSVFFEKAVDDTSFVAKMVFHNDPQQRRYYQTFSRFGPSSKNYSAVFMTTLDGSLLDTVITETFMKPLNAKTKNTYLHPGDTLALKLATMQRCMYEFWGSFNNYSTSIGTVFTSPKTIKGNVDGALGYWAGYGIDIKEVICK